MYSITKRLRIEQLKKRNFSTNCRFCFTCTENIIEALDLIREFFKLLTTLEAKNLVLQMFKDQSMNIK